jgi:hypothetical protein
MKGIGITMLQLLCASALQRWLLAIGTTLTLLGLGAQQSGWYPAALALYGTLTILGIVSAVASPLILDGILFRSLAALRSVQLIPHGRLKLVLGAVSAQLVLAIYIGLALGALLSFQHGVRTGGFGDHAIALVVTISVLAFGIVTLLFISMCWGVRFRFGGLVWLPFAFLPSLLSHAFPAAHLGARLVTARGLAILVLASLVAWLIFAIAFARARQITAPSWGTVGPGTSVPPATATILTIADEQTQYSRQQAMRILITGSVKFRVGAVSTVLIVGLLLAGIGIMILTGGVNGFPGDAGMICVFAAISPGIMTGALSRRAKLLWLTAGLRRAELFTAVEIMSWRGILIVTGFAWLFAAPLLILSIHARPENVRFLSILAIPLATGAAYVYFTMFLVRGKRLADMLVTAAFTVMLLAEVFSALSESRTWTLPALLVAQIILVPLLRTVAQRRWQTIDWLILRQLRPAGRLV